ncbi:hypothetical protein EAH88_11725 [Rhodanobacter glycinis]|uniref:Uncharacterized protein n=1 Tax=Rhodanobacter glycinis TaxID=582702 RepID=A0A502C988_9GAMM|nr:hypothetical protein [Rhodanobacter glycinis]TPG08296.1 hypothetical protein EAH88_11725 [Rhodanobacter glycinis]
MNRPTYTTLRHAARSASRAWFAALSDKYATTYDRDRARERMYAAIARVPGGVFTPYVYPVTLDGWLNRRRRVASVIAERKRKLHIADRLDAMSRFFGVAA